MSERLIKTINYPRSVVEIYMVGKDYVKEVKNLSDNRIKEYTYKVEEYLSSSRVSREVKGHLAKALLN